MSADWDASSSWSCTGPVAVRTKAHILSIKQKKHEVQDDHDEVPAFLRPPPRNNVKGAKRLKARKWNSAFDYEGRPVGFQRLLKSIALGGVDHSIRAEVWEFLLGCYGLGTTAEYRQDLRVARRERYRKLVEQCHQMHGSIGTGNLAYTVGSKVMDARLSTKGSGNPFKESDGGIPSAESLPEQEEEDEDEEGDEEEQEVGEGEEEVVEVPVVTQKSAPDEKISSPGRKLAISDEDCDGSPASLSAVFDSVYKKPSTEGPEKNQEGVLLESKAGPKSGFSRSPARDQFEGEPKEEEGMDDPSASASRERSTGADYASSLGITKEKEQIDGPSAGSNSRECSTAVDYSNHLTEENTHIGKIRENAKHRYKSKRAFSMDGGPLSWSAGSMKRINSWLLRDRKKKDRGLRIRDSTGGFPEDEGHKQRLGAQGLGSKVDMECDSLHEPVAALGRNASDERVAEWLWMLHRIAVDVVRTDRHLDFYGDAKNMARMSDILAVYAWVDPKTGYCQGMSDLLSPFIVIFEDDADAFWCFESLFKRVRQNFQMEGPVGVMKQLEALSRILEVTDPQMSKHLAGVGADNFLFAFRMLLVLFRREMSFGESLCMWEMMWAADFNQAMALSLEFNCLDALELRLSPSSFLSESGRSDDNSISIPPSMSFSSQYGSPPNEFSSDMTIPNSGAFGVNFLSRGPLCGLRPGGLLMKNRHRLPLLTSTLLGRNGDEELSVFCVAAILVQNRNKLLRDIQSMDDAIKTFNEMKLIIQVHSSVHAAMKLRKKYQHQLAKHASSPEKLQTANLKAD
ncbi:unnamed protein product [Calypogeia fissa]